MNAHHSCRKSGHRFMNFRADGGLGCGYCRTVLHRKDDGTPWYQLLTIAEWVAVR